MSANTKIIQVKAWQIADLIKAVEGLKKENTDRDIDWGINHGINAAMGMINIYLGPHLTEAKTPSNIEILTNH